MSVEYLICARTGHFADDVATACAQCAAPIVHRPHAPADTIKICARCAVASLADSVTAPDIQVTEETRREVALFFAKTPGPAQ